MADRSTVGDYVSLQRGTTYKGNLVGKPGPALLGLGSIRPGGGFRDGDYKTYGGDCPAKLMLTPGDLFVSLKGATKDGEMIGSIARVPKTVPSGRITQDTVKLVFHRPDQFEQEYIYWLLRTPQYRSYCAGRATGSAVVALSREDFLSYPVPSLSTTISCSVRLLEAIEKQLELNRTTNQTLEAMALAIFHSWFVNFDPVRAKIGSHDTGLPTDIANLFSDSWSDSPLGKIPSGWKVEPIRDLADVFGGTTPSTKEASFWEPQTHSWATPKDLASLSTPVLLATERRISDAGLAQIGSGLMPEGTVLLSSRAPIGYLAIAEIPVAINQGFIAMQAKQTVSNLFLLFWTGTFLDVIKSRANGSTFLEISKSNFRGIETVRPPSELMTSFDRMVRPIYERIVSNEKESAHLQELRDFILRSLTLPETSGVSDEGAA